MVYLPTFIGLFGVYDGKYTMVHGSGKGLNNIPNQVTFSAKKLRRQQVMSAIIVWSLKSLELLTLLTQREL